MSLVINHNLMAMNAARNLGVIYSRLAKSTERLSSGLRINSSGDDAAGLAIRELMRADINVIHQGIRNAADGISMIQTAEGAMGVIDEKLIRMKELAEQAATGTYTTAQREIMDSEYQAMADEIDRIANATDFNQTKLLDGSLSTFHEGSGMKIHFGTGNSATEDYYFVNIGDVRATSQTGLQVGGGATADIWTASSGGTTGETSLTAAIAGTPPEYLSFYYNANATSSATFANNPSNLVGLYEAGASTSLQDLITQINQGSAARLQVETSTTGSAAGSLGINGTANNIWVTIGNTTLQFYDGTAGALSATGADLWFDAEAGSAQNTVEVMVSAVNHLQDANVFGVKVDDHRAIFFAETAGVAGNNLTASDTGDTANNISWTNMSTGANNATSGNFALGGQNWVDAGYTFASSRYYLTLTGADRGDNYDVTILDTSADVLQGWNGAGASSDSIAWADNLDDYEPANFIETQDASGSGGWNGADILTQSTAQEALTQLDSAILKKDQIRANLGALQNRLENTITNITIQAENLQASESRISDVDVALEMTEFTKNNIMAQAATAMLAQANSVAQLALSLLG